MTRRLRRGLGALTTALLATVIVACSDDPSGPGTLRLTVAAPVPLGAAVVELRGDGIRGVEPLPSGWALLQPVPLGGSGPAVHRLLIVQESAGTLAVELEVDDVSAPAPAVAVVHAVDGSDVPLSVLGSVEVRLSR